MLDVYTGVIMGGWSVKSGHYRRMDTVDTIGMWTQWTLWECGHSGHYMHVDTMDRCLCIKVLIVKIVNLV